MDRSELLNLFKTKQALLEGHFLLSSGLHSTRYFQCALLLQEAAIATELGAQLARQFESAGLTCDVVVAPALGGILVAHEVGRALGVRGIFAERVQGIMELRRGFQIRPGERVLVVEDVITTGGSTREVLQLVHNQGGSPVAVGCLVDRSSGIVKFQIPFISLVQLDVAVYSSDNCPQCRIGSPVVKPGSRF